MSCLTLRKLVGPLVLVVTALSASTATAGELNYCDPTDDADKCECPESLNGYDSCKIIGESELINPANVAQYRQAIGLTSSWDSETGEMRIATDFSQLNGGGIVPIHENGGHWQSRAELQAYVEKLVGETVLKSYCEDGTLGHRTLDHSGDVARWDQEAGQWAHSQIPDPIWAAVSDAYGNVWIDEEVVAWLETELTGCQTKAQGDLAGTQCSDLLEWTYQNYRKVMCSEFGPGTETRTMREMGTEQKDFYWQGRTSEKVAYQGSDGQTRFRYVLVRYDRSRISNTYYDNSGAVSNPLVPHLAESSGDDYNKATRERRDGVCGDGDASRGQYFVSFSTSAGTAPSHDMCDSTLE